MRVGVSVRSAYVVDDVRVGARWMVERARAANEAGLDSLFVGDHHGVPVPYYQNVPIMGRMLAEWGDRPFGCLFLLPLWNPALVAEQVGTLASLAPGRFILQCAIGDDERQFASMGARLADRVSAFEHALPTMREIWERGRPAPVPPDPVDVWIGATAKRGIDRAARLGDGWLAGPQVTPDEAATLAEHYRQRCAAHGRDPGVVAIRRDVHVGADDADADRVAGPVVAAGHRGIDPSALVVAGPERTADELRRYAVMGYTDVIVRHLAEDQTEVLRSFERLAHVREALA